MKETFYFSHDYNARNDEKIIKLIQIEGWEGYGLYWAIIEKLYEADGFLEEDFDCIAFDLRTDSDRIARIVKDYKLFKVASKKICSESVLARLRKRKGKSESARQSANIRWNKQNNDDANAMPTQSEGNAIKESKVKETKVNNTVALATPSIKLGNEIYSMEELTYEPLEGKSKSKNPYGGKVMVVLVRKYADLTGIKIKDTFDASEWAKPLGVIYRYFDKDPSKAMAYMEQAVDYYQGKNLSFKIHTLAKSIPDTERLIEESGDKLNPNLYE